MNYDEPYHLTEEEVLAQNKRTFDWSLRIGIQLSNTIIADSRLASYFGQIKHLAREIAKESRTALLRVEAIPWKWEMDENFSRVMIRWASSDGTFCQVYHVKTVKLTADLTLLELDREENPFPGPHVESPFNPYKPRPGQAIAKGL